MGKEEKNLLFRKRFLQKSFINFLTVKGVYELLLNTLSDEDVQKLEDENVYFCRSYAPSCVTELKNTPNVEILQLIIFEAEYLKKFIPGVVIAIILHEIGHVFYPDSDLKQKEFKADDFAISKGYGKHLMSNLANSIKSEPVTFDNSINRERIERIKKYLLNNESKQNNK